MGYERDPYIWDTIVSLNERIKTGEKLYQEASEEKKAVKTRYHNALLAMKRRRRFVNQAFRVQCALPGLLYKPEDLFKAIYLLRQEYFIVNEDVAEENETFLKFEKEFLTEPAGEQLMRDIEFFDMGYDYDNWAQFYEDAQQLLNSMVFYILTGLNKIRKISGLPLERTVQK